ncbi:zinc finger protein Mlo2 [Schizosaccharomyces japonicus yFS275]|uniref:Zinc finger protein Mlo2 n=1 Tax=Schizosaccharomyces japonicus (strain yFS275 / FY16936) TaxID=402676 RepID=B6K280_SCHJY|nr:zinc finger protein Mlo2 [Schizosaccharomyces japonicus yFS275]EEB07261.1 zinc finger protein Mlo2 [Schizosaccharomyces japonicus yFS275]
MEEEKDGITVERYLKEQRELERQARLAMPYNFDKCTYDMGYIKQPLYACLTCKQNGTQNAVCYSCSICCHSTHELVELFDKRNFTCDCGTERMGQGAVCTLRKASSTAAPDNQYNHNFEGHFCTCDKFYDPTKEEGTMYQCLICEDWFHEECIAASCIFPDPDSFELFLCQSCVKANLKYLFHEVSEYEGGPVFLPEDFYGTLCQCERCLPARQKDMPMLAAEEDIYKPPEDEELPDEDSDEEQVDTETVDSIVTQTMDETMKLIDKLPRVQAIEGVHAYAALKDDLLSFLKPFASSNKVVTKEDVASFFAERMRDRSK